ncbi:MAG TPA: hypothetical protein VKV02_04690 [Acidobacteriaceae bacterium]|nr:hypothetical protein [Acidobacteriaceae bacterium]
MDHCASCRSEIPSGYYRVGTAIACASCVNKFESTEAANRGRYLRRGLLFGFGAAVVCWLVMWGVNALSSFTGGGVWGPGALFRGAATMFAGGLIGTAAKDGARKRGSRPLQIGAVVLTYLAWCMSLVAAIASNTPPARFSSGFLTDLILLGPVLPFLIASKNILAVTGIVVACLACAAAWKASAGTDLVTGPF